MADTSEDEREWEIANYSDRVERIQRGAEERTRARQEAARRRAAEQSRREHTVQGARERYNEDLQAGRIQHQSPILSGSEGGSQAVTSPATSIVGEAETMPESKKRKAEGSVHYDDAGAENDGNTDAEAAGFGLGRIRPLRSPECPAPGSLTRCYKKRMHFFLRPKTIKNMATRLTPISTNEFEVAGIGFQDWVVIPWKSVNMYMNRFDFNNLKFGSLMYNYKSAKVKLSNFSTHQGTVVGTGTPQVSIQMSGVAFESILISSKEIGPWFVGNATVDTTGEITACTSYSWNTTTGIFDTMSLNNNPANYYQSYPYRVVQIFRDCGDRVGQDQTNIINNDIQPNLIMTNMSNFSEFGFAQPPISDMMVNIKKKWRAGRIERPSIPRRVHSVGNVGNPNPYYHELASGESIKSMVSPAVVGSAIQKQGHIPTFRGNIFSDYGENIAPNEFTTVANYGNTVVAQNSVNPVGEGGNPFQINNGAFNEVQMFGFEHTGGDPQKDLFAFRIITPPNPIDASSDPDISICFTIETELEVEYIPVVEQNYMTRNVVATLNATYDRLVESTDTSFFQSYTQFPDPIAYSIPNFNTQYAVKGMITTGPRGTDITYANPPDANSIGY